jgi:hypothetical protein
MGRGHDHGLVRGIDLLQWADADRVEQATLRQPGAERGRLAVFGVGGRAS